MLSDMHLLLAGLLTMAYLAGSIPFGKIVGWVYKIDIQKRGSGNIGFANVRRVLGWRAGVITLAADILKGLIPVLVARHIFGENAAFVAGVCAVIGHVYPVWLRFHGGKGIATGLGMVLVLQPVAALVGVAVYIAGCALLKNSGRSSILGVGCLVITATLIRPGLWWQYVVMLCIALWTLRKNIAGTVPNYDT